MEHAVKTTLQRPAERPLLHNAIKPQSCTPSSPLLHILVKTCLQYDFLHSRLDFTNECYNMERNMKMLTDVRWSRWIIHQHEGGEGAQRSPWPVLLELLLVYFVTRGWPILEDKRSHCQYCLPWQLTWSHIRQSGKLLQHWKVKKGQR